MIFSSPLCKWLLRLELDILVHLIYRARDEPSSFHGGSFLSAGLTWTRRRKLDGCNLVHLAWHGFGKVGQEGEELLLMPG